MNTTKSPLTRPLTLITLTLACFSILTCSVDLAADEAVVAVQSEAPPRTNPIRQSLVESSAPTPVPAPAKTQDPNSDTEQDILLTESSIDAAIEAINDSDSLDESKKASVLERLQTAKKWIGERADVKKRIQQYQLDIEGAAERVKQAKAELKKAQAIEPITIPQNASVEFSEEQLKEAQDRLKKAQARLTSREEEAKGERKADLAKIAVDTRQRLEKVKQQLAQSAGEDASAEAQNARRREMRARIALLQDQLDLYSVEIRRFDALVELLPLQRDIAKREKVALEKHVAEIQAIVASKRAKESERLAQAARREAENAHPNLRELAERNTVLAERHQELATRMTAILAENTSLVKRIDALKNAFRKASDSVEKASHSTTVGLMLQKQRSELPDTHACYQRIYFVENELPAVHLEEMAYAEEASSLVDLKIAADKVLSQITSAPDDPHQQLLESTALSLLTTQRGLLYKLEKDLKEYVNRLTKLEIGNRQLIRQTNDFSTFIDEHVLWIRSADRFGKAELAATGEGLTEILSTRAWLSLARHSGLDAFRHPWAAGLVFGAVVALIVFHARLRRRISKLCTTKSYTAGLRYSPTIQAILLTAIASAEWPVLAYFFGVQMSRGVDASAFALAAGPAIRYVATMLFLSEFIRELCRKGGVAEIYFNWPAHGNKIARRETWWLAFLGLPLAGVVVFANLYQDGKWDDSLGRLAFVLGMFVLAGYTHTMMRAKDGVLQEAISRSPASWLNFVRRLLLVLGIGVSLSLAVLAYVGFYYSAQQLAIKLQASLGMALGVVIFHALITRWFLVKRRGLAMQQIKERQQLKESGEEHTAGPPVPVDQGPDLSAIHNQLQLLLRHAVTVGVLVSMWLIWADVLPALKVLDRVEFWRKSVQVVEDRENADGIVQAEKVWVDVPTTLRHGLLAGLLLLATLALGKNLPALLEITALKKLPLDRGGRHAISVISQYVIAITGVLLAGRVLNITWSSIQWLVAGMTVGLGFGLQEIFANFVSGLILLFERPIRVGDIITLGDVTGTVTDIRIRATTVTNWDRKELIVPNRELITGRLLNWTLTDTTNRIVINLGLAYDTNVPEAREIILKAVRDHENVLSDPGPNVTFEGFGDSCLNFVVRAYVASMDVRLSTVHELHLRIHEELQQRGIEIPFMQVDMNVRQLPETALINPPLPVKHPQRPDAA